MYLGQLHRLQDERDATMVGAGLKFKSKICGKFISPIMRMHNDTTATTVYANIFHVIMSIESSPFVYANHINKIVFLIS